MELKVRRKWYYLFLSLMLLAVCFFGLQYISRSDDNILGIFGYLMIGWITLLPFAFVILALRIFRRLSKDSFIYVLSGLYTSGLGSAGIIFAWGNGNKFGHWIFIYFVSLILGLLMFADSFVCELFDFIKSKKALK
jgi:hypothetical protein